MPSKILKDNRFEADETPWVVRHNFSYIKSEHPDRPGNVSYGFDSSGSYALCALARPFSNRSKTGKLYEHFNELTLGFHEIEIGYKVFNNQGELLNTNSYMLMLELGQ